MCSIIIAKTVIRDGEVVSSGVRSTEKASTVSLILRKIFAPRLPPVANSFNDASIGVISLVASIYIFGVLGRNDVRVLTLISIWVVAGLRQEVGVVGFATQLSCWPVKEHFGAFDSYI